MPEVPVTQSKWQVYDAAPEHTPKILELFKAVFGQEMSEAHWHWKYGEGRGAGIVVHEGDELVSYFGGMERRILFKGYRLRPFRVAILW